MKSYTRLFPPLFATVVLIDIGIELLSKYFADGRLGYGLYLIDGLLVSIALYPAIRRFVYAPLAKEVAKRNRAELEFRNIFESSPNALLTIEATHGTITKVNPQAEELFGYRADELLGKPIEILVPRTIRDKHVALRASYVSNPQARPLGKGRDLYAERKDGSQVPVEIALTPIFDHQLVVLTTVTDIHVRKETERQRDEALRAQEELIAVVSHEIKNPLTTMMSALELLKRALPAQEPNGRDQKLVKQIHLSIMRVIDITSDLLDLSRIEAGYLSLAPAQHDCKELIDELLIQFEHQAAEKKIQLKATIHPEAKSVFCDKKRIIQVLTNLIGNALKFSPPASTIQIGAEPNGELVTVTVADSGPGIPQHQIERVFERFWQAKTRQYEGTGLGLYISKKIVSAHGGTMGARSEVGKGSVFFFTLATSAAQATASAHFQKSA